MIPKYKYWAFLVLPFWLFNPSLASANYYAYIPDLAAGSIHVINTDYMDIASIKEIPLFGSPRDVLINNTGDYVYVTTEFEENNISNSYLNRINTLTQGDPSFVQIPFEDVRGMALSRDDSTLFITHKVGVTKIIGPFSTNGISDVATTYRGAALALSDDDAYLFIVGTDEGLNSGVSIVDTASMEEISSYLLGSNKDSMAIALNWGGKKLYVTNRATSELVVLDINLDTASDTIELVSNDLIDLGTNSHPFALALNFDKTELYISLSFDSGSEGTGDGTVVVVNVVDENLPPIQRITISDEDSEYTGGSTAGGTGIIHPYSVAMRDDGTMFFLKRLWSDKQGLYISEVADFTTRSGERFIEEGKSLLISNRASVLSNGKFIGPFCEKCPDGLPTIEEPFERPSALHPLFFLFFVIVAFLRRRKY